jgi:hypothetical protein
MGMIDDALVVNKRHAQGFGSQLSHRRPKLAVLTCMDPSLSELEAILGLNLLVSACGHLRVRRGLQRVAKK